MVINSFGFGGSNVNLILRSNPKPKSIRYTDNKPVLVQVSGRTEECVDFFLKKVFFKCFSWKWISCIVLC